MKNKKFIKLNPVTPGNLNYYINPFAICGITVYPEQRVVNTIGGQVYNVIESYEEIMKLIEDSEKITLINK